MATIQRQITQIYNYTKANGNSLQSQKVLKEIQKHPDTAWVVLCQLCSKLKNKTLDNAASQMIFTLPDSSKHQNSHKWLKEFMQIRDLSLKLCKQNFHLMDVLKPQKQKIINLFAKIVQVSKQMSSIKKQYDQLIVREDLISKQITKLKNLEQETQNYLNQIIQTKKNERPLYQQKIKVLQSVKQQLNSKRNEKIQHFSKQKYLKDQISNEEKVLDQLKYDGQNLQLRIEQIKNQIARNAPEYKKQKNAVNDQFNRTDKQIQLFLDRAKNRQKKIKLAIDNRKKFKSQLYKLVTKLVDSFTLLDQSKSKFSKARDDNQNYKKKKNNIISFQIDRQQMLKNYEIELQNSRGTKETLERQKKALDYQFSKLSIETSQLLYRIQQYKHTVKKLSKFREDLEQKVQVIKSDYKRDLNFSQNEITKWMAMFDKNIDKMFSPISEINTTLENKLQFKRSFV